MRWAEWRYTKYMVNRRVKQLLYGLFYLSILTLIMGGIYLWVRPAPSCADGKLNQKEEEADCGGPCVPCEIKRLKAIRALPPQFFSVNGRATVMLEFQNPNSTYGAKLFRYEVNIYDRDGATLKSLVDSSFIYPGEVKLVVIPALEIDPRTIARGETLIQNPSWEPAEKFSRPAVETRETVTIPEGTSLAVQGVIRNGNLFSLSRVNIASVVSDKSGFFVNASKTFVADLKPFEERFFKITVPLAPGEAQTIDPKRTRIFAEIIK